MTFRLVIGEPDGRTHFNKLLFRREWPCFYAFDVLSIEGEDLTALPLLECKRRLAAHHADDLANGPFRRANKPPKTQPCVRQFRSHRYG